MKSSNLLFLLLCCVISMTGCAVEYQYTPPTSEQGLECIMQCQSIKTECRDYEMESARIERIECKKTSAYKYERCQRRAFRDFSICERKAKNEYYSCLKYAENRATCVEEICVEEYCYEDSCYSTANYNMCKSDYSQCYQACGGIIEVIK
ncbi:MAG: hypothetical protein OCC45_02990 [Desulfotalea sp.]